MQIDGISIDRQQALAAVAAVGERTADVIAAMGDLDERTRGLDWTLGQTAAHIVVDVQYHRAWLRGEGKIDYFVPDLAGETCAASSRSRSGILPCWPPPSGRTTRLSSVRPPGSQPVLPSRRRWDRICRLR
jgi:hypothetical protein